MSILRPIRQARVSTMPFTKSTHPAPGHHYLMIGPLTYSLRLRRGKMLHTPFNPSSHFSCLAPVRHGGEEPHVSSPEASNTFNSQGIGVKISITSPRSCKLPALPAHNLPLFTASCTGVVSLSLTHKDLSMQSRLSLALPPTGPVARCFQRQTR